MRRRTVLQYASGGLAGFAGCLDLAGDQASGPSTDTSPAGSRQPTTGTTSRAAEVTLDDLDDASLGETFDVRAAVTVVDPSVTTSSTAVVEVVLTTTTEPVTLTYTRRTCDLNLIAGRYREADQFELLLLPRGIGWAWTDPDCPVPDGRNLACGIPGRDHVITVSPEGALTWQFELWVDPENPHSGGCLPAGTCRFRRAFRAGDASADLSFTLGIR